MIDLPLNPQPNGAEPYFLDFGGWQVPPMGGPATRIDRLGDRHGVQVSLPPMRFDDDKRGIHAREWISRLKRGMSEGVRLTFPQPGFVPAQGLSRIGAIGVAAAAGATSINIKGLAENVALEEGMFFSVVDANGRHFLHSIAEARTVDPGGAEWCPIFPRLRTSFAVDAPVHMGTPKIEGRVVGDRFSWTLELARTVGLQFAIEENA